MEGKGLASLRLERITQLQTGEQTTFGSQSPKNTSPSRSPKVRSARIREEQMVANQLRRTATSRTPYNLRELPPKHTPAFYIRKAKEKRINLTSRPTSASSRNLFTFRSECISPLSSPKSTQRRASMRFPQSSQASPMNADKPQSEVPAGRRFSEISEVIPAWVIERGDFLSTFEKIKSGSGIDIFEVCKLLQGERKERENLFLANWAAQIPFFANLPRHAMRDVCVKLTSVFAPAGSTSKFHAVIKQGDQGDCMYVIYKGTVDVLVHGNKVAEFSDKTVFGEGALMSRAGRTATVVAKVDTKLLKLTQQDHDSVVLGAKKREKYNFTLFLHTIPFFDVWQLVKVHRLSNALISTHFAPGQVIYDIGAKSASLYILKEGQVEIQTIIRLDESNRWPIGNHSWELSKFSKRVIVRLKLCEPKDLFGDLEMVAEVPRSTRAVSLVNSQCLVINREEFFTIFTHKEAEALLKYTHLMLPPEKELAETVVEASKTERKMVFCS